jgi:hypothetical protein
MAGLAAIISVLKNHPDSLTPGQRAKADQIQALLEKFLSEEEDTVGKHRGPDGAPSGRS